MSNFISEMSAGLKIASVISGYIIGPILLFGIIGYALDQYWHTNKLALIISLVVAFICSNVLILKDAPKIGSRLNSSKNSKSQQ